MGIQDRDYMRRSPDDDDRDASPDTKAEEFLGRFLQRHPRFFLYVGIGLGALIVLALVLARFSGGH